jgi:hypothetical protein
MTGCFGSRAADQPGELDATKPQSTLLMPDSSSTVIGRPGLKKPFSDRARTV